MRSLAALVVPRSVHWAAGVVVPSTLRGAAGWQRNWEAVPAVLDRTQPLLTQTVAAAAAVVVLVELTAAALCPVVAYYCCWTVVAT